MNSGGWFDQRTLTAERIQNRLEVNWVRNLRAGGEAVLTRGRQRDEVEAVELAPAVAGPLLRDALAPYMRGRLRAAFARLFVPLRRDATLDDYVEHARHHPTFELRPRTRTAATAPQIRAAVAASRADMAVAAPITSDRAAGPDL